MSLEKEALEWLNGRGSVPVQRLYDALRIRKPSLTELDITELVWKLSRSHQVVLEDPVFTNRSTIQFLRLWEWMIWFYAVLIIAPTTILVIYLVPAEAPLAILRWLLSSLFLFFLPGHMLVQILYPKTDQLQWIEKIVFSVGLSIVLVMIIGLALNQTAWGLALSPIVTSLTFVTIGLAIIAILRRHGVE